MRGNLYCTPCGRATVNDRLALRWALDDGFDVKLYARTGEML